MVPWNLSVDKNEISFESIGIKLLVLFGYPKIKYFQILHKPL